MGADRQGSSRFRPSRIVRDGAWVALGQAVVALAGLAGARILTTILPPAVYGQVSLVVGLGALGAGMLVTPFLQAALRSYPEAREAGTIGALRALARHYVRRGVLLIAGLLLAVGAAWAAWGPSSASFAAFAAAAALVAFDAWRTYESDFLTAARRQRDFAVRVSLDALARPAAAAGLVWWLGPSAFHVVAGFAVATGAVDVLLRRRVVPGEAGGAPGDHAWADAHAATFLKYAMPLVPLAALNWVMSMGDRYVLASTWGVEAVGVYWAAYALGSQPFIAAGALINTTLRPVLYDAVARGDARKERRTLRARLLVVLVVAGGGWAMLVVLAKPLCALLLGPAYAGAAVLLPWIGAAYALQMVQQTFEAILYAHGQSKRLVVLQAVAAGAAVLLYAALIPRSAALGAAIGTLGSFVITTALAFVLSDASRRIFGSQAVSA